MGRECSSQVEGQGTGSRSVTNLVFFGRVGMATRIAIIMRNFRTQVSLFAIVIPTQLRGAIS